MGFPERLKELRESRGLSQEALADTLGIPRSSITHYEKSQLDDKERLPRRERLEKIADYFGVSVDYLLGRTNDPSPSNKKEKPEERKDTITNVFFREWDKADEEKKKRTLEFLQFLNQMDNADNNKK
jgi:transcriptional regulator with XRE-family HTH domain